MSRRKVILSSIIVMVLSLVSVFSIGVFEHIMDLRDKSDATYYPLGYDFHSASAISKADYNDNTGFGISNAEGLKGFLASCKDRTWEGKTIWLNTDINMNGYETYPAGSEDGFTAYSYNTFAGTFDGNYHTISNLKIKAPKDNGDPVYAGIFGKIGNCTIKEIRFLNCTVSNANEKDSKPLYMGIIAGTMTVESLIHDCVIDSCSISNSAKVTNIYTSPTAGGCIDEYDLSNVYGTISGSVYTWNSSLNLSFGGLIRVCVRSFANSDTNGGKLGPEVVSFSVKYIANDGVGSKKTAYLAIMNIKDCVIGDSVTGGTVCGVTYYGYDNNYEKNIYWYVGNGYALVFEPIINYVYDDANDYSRLTVANETMDPSGYTWYRSAIAYNDTPYLARFVTANILVQSNNGSYGHLAYRDRWGNVRKDNQSSFYLYFPYEVFAPRHDGSVFWPFRDSAERVEAYAHTDNYCSFVRWDYAPLNGNVLTQHAVATFSQTDSYVVSFKPAPNDNLYLNSSETIKPYLFDANGNQVSPGFASTDSNGTLKVTVPINTNFKFEPDYWGNNTYWFRIYILTINNVDYHVLFYFEEEVPNRSINQYQSSTTIKSPLDITTTFSGGYVNVTFGAVDHATETDLSSNGFVHRVAKGSEVTAVYDTENYSWIEYSIGGVEKIKYTCEATYWISHTRLGSNLDTSMTISSNTTIAPEIKGQSDKRTLNFESVNVSDSVGNSKVYYPTYTKNSVNQGELKSEIELRTQARISCEEITKGYRFTVIETDDSSIFVVTYLANDSSFEFTGYTYEGGIKQGIVENDASVSVSASYTTLTTIKFELSDNAYLYAPVSTPVYVDNYATADFGTNYINSTGVEFENFLDYESSTYTVNIASDNATASKPKLERVISEENDIYTITYVVSYKLYNVSKKAEVAQYLAESNVMRLVNDGYTDGSTIASVLAVKPQMSYPAIIFEQPIDTVKASMFKNNYVQSSASQYILGSNLVITNNPQKKVTYISYGDIDVEIHPQNIIYTFDVYTTTKTFSANSVSTSSETTEEVIEYKINDGYKSSAWLQPAYSDSSISTDATSILFSQEVIIAPAVRTDCQVEFTAVLSGIINVVPTLKKNGNIVTSSNNLDSFITFNGNNKITIKLSYANQVSIKYDKQVDLENGKNKYVFTFSISGNNYEISFDLIDNASYELVNDVFTYGESKTIDQDIKVQCEAELKDYTIN